MPKPNRRGNWRAEGGAARLPPARPNSQSDELDLPEPEGPIYLSDPEADEGDRPSTAVRLASTRSEEVTLVLSDLETEEPACRTQAGGKKKHKKNRPHSSPLDHLQQSRVPPSPFERYLVTDSPAEVALSLKQPSPSPPSAGADIHSSPPSAGVKTCEDLAMSLLQREREVAPLQAELARLREDNLQLQLEAAHQTYEAIKQRIM
jgi:hypothetical protein